MNSAEWQIRREKKCSGSNCRYYLDIRLESYSYQNSRSAGRISNSGPSIYETGTLPTRPWLWSIGIRFYFRRRHVAGPKVRNGTQQCPRLLRVMTLILERKHRNCIRLQQRGRSRKKDEETNLGSCVVTRMQDKIVIREDTSTKTAKMWHSSNSIWKQHYHVKIKRRIYEQDKFGEVLVTIRFSILSLTRLLTKGINITDVILPVVTGI
jgi:hypothetical protein